MSKCKRYKKGSNYLDEYKEWNEHKYSPGYYTGGRIPPIYKYAAKPGLLGWLYISGSIFIIVFIIVKIISGINNKTGLFEFLNNYIFIIAIAVLYIFVGLGFLKRRKAKKKR